MRFPDYLLAPRARKVTVPELLYTILDLAGIKASETPELYIWKSQLGIERKLKIESLEYLMQNFGVGVFQIVVLNPNISGIDPDVFRITLLSITIAYEGNGVWSDPEIQTEEEEITADYGSDFKTRVIERTRKIGLKLKDVMVLLSIISNITNIAGNNSGS